jgi:hypothetical protein
MEAVVKATGQAATLVIVGGGVVVVVNVKFVEVAIPPKPLLETTKKSYVVPGVKPVSVTEWAVTIELSTGDCEP